MPGRFLVTSTIAALAALAVPLAGSPAGATPQSSTAEPKAPRTIVDLRDVAPSVLHDIRYTTPHNFVGSRIVGYWGSRCLLTRDAARALARVQSDVRKQGYSLKVYDCYRPQRAVDHFVRWSARSGDQKMKREFYPRVAKSTLFDDGYIARRSGHSRASTVDLTLVKLPAAKQERWVPSDGLQKCYWPRWTRFPDNSIDMGTGYDCFDTRSHTKDSRNTWTQRTNRQRLVSAMAKRGFTNYAKEWWHFTLDDEPYPRTYFDFPVVSSSLTS